MIILDSFCSDNNVIPDFIKIDVEKIELEVIKGAKNLLKSCGPILSLKIYINERLKEYREALNILKNLGYNIFYINEKGELEKFEYGDFFKK